MADHEHEAADHAFDEELTTAAESPQDHLDFNAIREIKLEISADLGEREVTVREVLELQRGSVLELNKLAGEMADIYVNGIPFGRGEIVVLVDSLNVRVAEVVGATEKDIGHVG